MKAKPIRPLHDPEPQEMTADKRSKLVEAVHRTIAEHHLFEPGEKIVLGISGGPDSLCMLYVMELLREELDVRLHIAHLDHGLREKAAQEDASYVEDVSRRLGLPVTIEKIDVRGLARREKWAVEEAARRARYTFLAEVARAQGTRTVAVAHHADDQVESIVMHWLRGAGLAGLRGMRPLQPYPLEGCPDLRLARPLLEVTRVEIEAFCRQQGIQPRWDLSNLDTTLHRNRIRLELLPLLETFNPNLRQVLRRSAQIVAADYDFISERAEEAWQRVARVGGSAVHFSRSAWTPLHPSLKRTLLRRAIQALRASLRNIDWIHIQSALEALETKPAGTRVTLPRGLQLFIGYDGFVVGEELPLDDVPLLDRGQEVRVQAPGRTPMGTGWQLVAEEMGRPPAIETSPDPWQAFLDLERAGRDLTLRTRRRGDRFHPLGLEGKEKLLREFMIDAKISRHLRERLPLLTGDPGILWVCGYRLDERVKVSADTRRILRLRFERRL